MVGFKEETRKVEETVTSVTFEVVAPERVVKDWLENTLDYIGKYIHKKVRGDIKSDGLTHRITIEVAKPLTIAEKFTIKLLIYSLGRAIYNVHGTFSAIERMREEIETNDDDWGLDTVW